MLTWYEFFRCPVIIPCRRMMGTLIWGFAIRLWSILDTLKLCKCSIALLKYTWQSRILKNIRIQGMALQLVCCLLLMCYVGKEKAHFNELIAKVAYSFCFWFSLQCPHRPWPDRQWGLCMFDDVIEHCSPSSFKYAEYFLRPMLQSICDNSPEVRQAAAYGVGVMAQFGGDNYRPFCTGVYGQHIFQVWSF